MLVKNYKKVKLCTRTKIKHGFVKSLFPSVTIKWPIRNYLFGETVLCSPPYLNNYTVNDQSLSDMQKWQNLNSVDLSSRFGSINKRFCFPRLDEMVRPKILRQLCIF